ncbi:MULTISPECIES: hypothetical protein [unclassified Streptomyces]|uniref:hypothetical protein n=1 Tax=unclassified Streptomyces TaxID=2593676 RepID=UPI003D708F48
MNVVTAHTEEKPAAARRPETGWARARRLRRADRALRTWIPAVIGPDPAQGTRRGVEGTIVRGED